MILSFSQQHVHCVIHQIDASASEKERRDTAEDKRQKEHSFFFGMLCPGSLGCWKHTGSGLYNRPLSLSRPLVSYDGGQAQTAKTLEALDMTPDVVAP